MLVFVILVAVAFLGISDTPRAGVRRLEHQIAADQEMAQEIACRDEIASREADVLSEARFTQSLLSLSKVHSQARHDSPEPVPGESSSLVLVPQRQSKNPGRVS